MARLVQDGHQPGARLGERLGIVADEGGAQSQSLAPGFLEVAKQRAFRVGEVFRRDNLEPKPAHHTLRSR
jgi:hypothetical protein